MMRVISLCIAVAGAVGCAGAGQRIVDSPIAESPIAQSQGTGVRTEQQSGAGSGVGPATSAVTTLLAQGRAERQAGELARASATLERAMRIEPRDPSVWLELANLRFAEGDYAQAEQMARKAMSLAPERSPVWEQAAQLINALR